jgi:hypothetical protein
VTALTILVIGHAAWLALERPVPNAHSDTFRLPEGATLQRNCVRHQTAYVSPIDGWNVARPRPDQPR